VSGRGTPELVGWNDQPPTIYIRWSEDPYVDENGDSVAPERWVPEQSRPYQEVFDAIDAEEAESGGHRSAVSSGTASAETTEETG
jgi:hypothetical protein